MESGIKVTRATWSNYETGATEPTLDTLIQIAKFFRISLDDLLLCDLVKEPDDTVVSASSAVYSPGLEKMTLEDNEETTLWYLLKEMKAIRKDLDNLKNRNS